MMNIEKVTTLSPRGGWLRRWKAFGLTFAVGKGCGIKAKWPKGCNRAKALNGQRKTGLMANAHKKKPTLYERQGGCCWLCRRPLEQKRMQIHHVLPLVLYPELGSKDDNLMLLCPECHRHIHQNALLSANLIRERAVLLGVGDLAERFGEWTEKNSTTDWKNKNNHYGTQES